MDGVPDSLSGLMAADPGGRRPDDPGSGTLNRILPVLLSADGGRPSPLLLSLLCFERIPQLLPLAEAPPTAAPPSATEPSECSLRSLGLAPIQELLLLPAPSDPSDSSRQVKCLTRETSRLHKEVEYVHKPFH